ncbi:unnamed protein product, partial [Mesorhabditis spiculigera]
MHSLIREQLQSFLYSYKKPTREEGLPVVYDAAEDHAERKEMAYRDAVEKLEVAKRMKVGFAVRANRDYDGALDRHSPLIDKTISFHKSQFLHIHARYSPEWWIGRIVEKKGKMGFIPTARRLGRMEKKIVDEDGGRIGPSSIWECPAPYTVVPSSRPVLFIGPAFHGSQDGNIWGRTDYEENEKELKAITILAEDLKILLLEAPHINTPMDLKDIHLAPIIVQIRVSNRSVLMRLMNKTGIGANNKKTELAGVDALSG